MITLIFNRQERQTRQVFLLFYLILASCLNFLLVFLGGFGVLGGQNRFLTLEIKYNFQNLDLLRLHKKAETRTLVRVLNLEYIQSLRVIRLTRRL